MNKINERLQIIINDWDYYKFRTNTINLLEILSKKTNNEDFIIKKIKELMKEFEEKEDDHFKLKILDNYIKTNEKKYLKK